MTRFGGAMLIVGATLATASQASARQAQNDAPHDMSAMDAATMADVMGMDDDATFSMLKFDRFEHALDGDSAAWKGAFWSGGDVNRVLVRSEGAREHGNVDHADVEFLWNHAAAAFWDTQLGVRRDVGRGADRSWAAFGVQGLAPYGFEVEATAYVGDAGRSALRVEVEHELLLTQRLILQPRFEVEAYGRDDAAAHVGAGISDVAFGFRLRYEIRRQFAPYVGIERTRRFGGTADAARVDGMRATDTEWVAGVRFWF